MFSKFFWNIGVFCSLLVVVQNFEIHLKIFCYFLNIFLILIKKADDLYYLKILCELIESFIYLFKKIDNFSNFLLNYLYGIFKFDVFLNYIILNKSNDVY